MFCLSKHLVVCSWQYSKLFLTIMLVLCYPGRLGTTIFIFTVESPQPVVARHTSCTQLLWKPHDPSREDTPIYLVTFETSRLVGARNTSCKQLLWNPRDPSREGTHIYLVTFETSRPLVSRHTSCTQLLWKLHDPSREDTPISLVTFVSSVYHRFSNRKSYILPTRCICAFLCGFQNK
jgi:hypothetical protein